MLCYTVMNMISRKPVYLFDIDLEVLNDPAPDILEFERVGPISAVITHRADQPGASLPGERKHGKEISLFEVRMQLTIDCRAGRLDIRDIKKVTVGAARIPRAH